MISKKEKQKKKKAEDKRGQEKTLDKRKKECEVVIYKQIPPAMKPMTSHGRISLRNPRCFRVIYFPAASPPFSDPGIDKICFEIHLLPYLYQPPGIYDNQYPYTRKTPPTQAAPP